MKPANFLRYVVLPVLALGAGVKLGVEYAKRTYVAADRKFIEGKILNKDD